MDVTDIARALEHPDSQRRFHVVESERELIEMLNAPLALEGVSASEPEAPSHALTTCIVGPVARRCTWSPSGRSAAVISGEDHTAAGDPSWTTSRWIGTVRWRGASLLITASVAPAIGGCGPTVASCLGSEHPADV